jgi:hypothetical protein
MIKKFIFFIQVVVVCCLLFSAKAFAASDSDIEINVTSPIDSLQTESGVVAVEHFPAESLSVYGQNRALTDIQLEHGGQNREITPDYTLTIEKRRLAAHIPSPRKRTKALSSPSQPM